MHDCMLQGELRAEDCSVDASVLPASVLHAADGWSCWSRLGVCVGWLHFRQLHTGQLKILRRSSQLHYVAELFVVRQCQLQYMKQTFC